MNITGAEGTNDHLTVNALGGNDMVDASDLPANLIGLTVNLGDGQAAATTTTLRTSTGIAVSGQSVFLTATVSSMTGTPTGTVTFMDGKVVVGTAAVDVDGTATILTSFVGPGVHAITAVYSGDGNFVGSSSTVTEQVIAPVLAATRTSLFAAAQPARRRHPVVFRATVHGHEGVSSPTGTVTFMVGNVTVAQVKLDGNDQARWTGRFSFRGRFTVRAIYSGDGNFSSSSSSLTERIVGKRS